MFERWDRVGELEDPTGYLFRVSMNVFRGRYRRALLAVRRSLCLGRGDRRPRGRRDP